MTNTWADVLDSASSDVRRLDYVDRFSSIPVLIKENVSAHSYWVSLYSVLIHRHLQGDDSLLGAILLHAVTHDLTEALTGDVVRTFKYSSPEFKTAVDTAEDNLFPMLHESVRELFPLWQQLAGVNYDYVKAVVKAADFVSLHQYMVREMDRGNKEIAPFAARMINDLFAEGEKFAKSSNPKIAQIGGLFSMMAKTHVSGKRTP